MSPRQFPVGSELLLMLHCPLRNEGERLRRQSPPKNPECLDGDDCFLIPVTDVEVWWGVVVVEHRDDDAEEPADLWHRHLIWECSPAGQPGVSGAGWLALEEPSAEGVGFEPTDPCGSPVFKTRVSRPVASSLDPPDALPSAVEARGIPP